MQHSSASSESEDEISTPEELAGREIRRLRTARGWSQEEVAERMKAYGYDWHQTLIGRIEGAQRPLRLNEAADLAALYGVPLDRLLIRPQTELDITKLRAQVQASEEDLSSARVAYVAARSNQEAAAQRAHASAAELEAATTAARMAEATVARTAQRLAALANALEEVSRGRRQR